MTAELVRGQNLPLPAGQDEAGRWEIRVSAGTPVIAAATLGDEQGRVGGSGVRAGDARGLVVHPGAPCVPGLEVSRQAAAEHRIAVDLGALPESVHRVHVVLALPESPGAPARFGGLPAPRIAVTATDGTEAAGFTVTGLDSESAVLGVELYRRQGAWKVRAVGQGYVGGLSALLLDQGVPDAGTLAAGIHRAVADGLARTSVPPAAVDAAGPAAVRAGPTAAPPSGVAPHHVAEGITPQEPAPRAAAPQDPAPRGPALRDPAPHGADACPPPAAAPVDYRHPRRRPASAPQASAPQVSAPQVSGAPSVPGTQPRGTPTGTPSGPPSPVAGDAAGWTMEERLYNQVWGMFEDLSRTTAAYRSAVDFADSRFEGDLDRMLSDAGTRSGPAADAARERARARREVLVDQARAVLDRDVAHLLAESEVVEPALPPALAGWESPVWHGYSVPTDVPTAVRLGNLHGPERPDLRIPLLVALPLARGLWIDSARDRGLAADMAVTVAARLLASYPAGEFAVRVIDPAGSAEAALRPLTESGALQVPPAVGAAGVAAVLAELTQRVDLVQMALRAGAPDALPPGLDTAGQLLVVHDFPFGFDDRSITRLRYLADEGPSVGVHLLLVADQDDARAYGPVLDPLWRSLMRLSATPDDHLADPWVGHRWTFEPLLVPPGSDVLPRVLRQVTAARWACDS